VKSLAHPDWPYTGTPHEWRGFVKEIGIKSNGINRLGSKREPKEITPLDWYPGETFEEAIERSSVYQKQNFGPDLK
jgi:hypothetical protein